MFYYKLEEKVKLKSPTKVVERLTEQCLDLTDQATEHHKAEQGL